MRTILLSFLIAIATVMMAQNTDVPFNGMVYDAAGRPAKKARVYHNSKNKFAEVDSKGRFGLLNVDPEATLIIKFKKMEYSVPVNGRKSIIIRIGDQTVEEVTEDEKTRLLGMNYVSEREIIRKGQSYTGEQLRLTGEVDLESALSALQPNLNVSRGVNTINGSTDMLYVLDGTIISDPGSIDLYSIDYVTVNKSGSGWGMKGSNGAIEIHTINSAY